MSGVVVDASALVAVVTGEPGWPWLEEQLHAAEPRLIAAPTVLELGIVLQARRSAAGGFVRKVLRDAGIVVRPFDEEHAERAQDAWRRFGRGRHPAALNFGDCCTYALAEQAGHPILCVGNDFSRTDLPVLRPPD